MTKHIYRNCEWCSIEYKVRADCKNQKFCSKNCRILGYKKAPIYQTKNKLAYYSNPTICKGCGCCLIYDFRKNKFCTNSCSTTFNNKNKKSPNQVPTKELACSKCGAQNIVDGRCPSYICIECKQGCRKRTSQPRKRIPYSKFSYCAVCSCTIPHKYNKTCSRKCLLLHLSSVSRSQTFRRLMRYTKEYNGTMFDSSYEVAVAKSLDECKIEWFRPGPLQYTDADNKVRHYYPDFYLPKFNVYLDPKNDYLIKTQCNKIRAAAAHNGVKILILSSLQLEWHTICDLIKHNSYCGR
jgi:hypothetical protein